MPLSEESSAWLLRRAGTLELVLDDLHESVERLSTAHQAAVDEEGGHAFHAEARPILHILLHRGPVGAVGEALLEGREVEPGILGVGLQIVRTGLGRVGVKQVMIRPELPLVLGAAGRLVRLAGPGVELGKRHDCFHFSILTRYEILRMLKAKQAVRQIALFEQRDIPVSP